MYSGKIAVPPGGGGIRKKISLLTKVNNEQPSPSNERFSLILLVNVDRRFSIFIATVEK
jgi:hypothetical protein